MIKHVKEYAMSTKLFWRIYFWHGMRQARKNGIRRLLPGHNNLR